MSITIDTAFDGGNLGTVREVSADRVVASIHLDRAHDGVCSQATWYYARFTDLSGPFTVILTDLGGVYNGRPADSIDERDAPRVSDDGVHWRVVTSATFDRAARTLAVPLEPRGDTLWLAHLEPYVSADLERLRATLHGHPDWRFEVIGESVEGRPLRLWTVGDDDSPHCVWLMARQHAWETHTSWCFEGVARQLASPEAAPFRARCCVKLLPLMDPDGVVHGKTRFNSHGYDVNRHWDSTDPGDPEHRRLRPEIAAVKAAVSEWLAQGRPIDAFINLHDTHEDIFDVPSECADSAVLRGLYARLREGRFSGACRISDGGHPGVIQTALCREYGVPGALIELGTMELPTYGRHPTAADRVEFGADLARALAAVIGR